MTLGGFINSIFDWFKRNWRTVVMAVGVIVMADGIISMIIYQTQTWQEQALRAFRVGLGALLVYLGWKVR